VACRRDRASASDFGHPVQGQTLVLDPLVFLGRKRPTLDAAIVDFVVFAIADCALGNGRSKLGSFFKSKKCSSPSQGALQVSPKKYFAGRCARSVLPQCRASHGRASESRSGIWQVASTSASTKVNGFIGGPRWPLGAILGRAVAARKASIVCICSALCPVLLCGGGEWNMFRVARPKEGRGPHVVSWVAANLQGKTRGARTDQL